MYLARVTINSKTHYVIRQSTVGDGCMLSSDLLDLGTDPAKFIIYPGGRSYYLEPWIEESLLDAGLHVGQEDLEAIFFDFLKPETQRLISRFDRSQKKRRPRDMPQIHATPHDFDKRRFHFLRFGKAIAQPVNRIPEFYFQPLLNKSRDEMEQYFLSAERILGPDENPNYLSAVFVLNRFIPSRDSGKSLVEQLDEFFIDRLCRINADPGFRAGVPEYQGLYGYLVKYAVMYFDGGPRIPLVSHDYVREFINRHRKYTPPLKVRVNVREAERLFERSWKELRGMDRSALSRLYRRMALKHHPDRGGNSALFQRLSTYYQALLAKK